MTQLRRSEQECASPRELPQLRDLESARVWFADWLHNAALPLWWERGADRMMGGFYEVLAHNGRGLAVPRRARVQARQTFAYARAGRMGWDGPWGEAAQHGLRFLRERYLNADGLVCTTVDADGNKLDVAARTYDQAFVLLALAELHRAGEGAEFKSDAEALLTTLQARRDDSGAFTEVGQHGFQSNANMHMFEAALAWTEASGGTLWRTLADELGAFALDRLIDAEHGFIREFYDGAWRPAAGADGRRLEPGHLFEWAWLLHRWSTFGNARAASAGRRLYDAGLRGLNARSLAVDAIEDTYAVIEPSARLWPQTELLKAALAYGDEVRALETLHAIAAYLNTPLRGMWCDRMLEHGFVIEPAPASTLYHLIGAIDELLGQAK